LLPSGGWNYSMTGRLIARIAVIGVLATAAFTIKRERDVLSDVRAAGITPENVNRLQRAWVYRFGGGTSDSGDPEVDGRFEVTPVIAGDVMYISTPSYNDAIPSTVAALEPETGKEIWKYVAKAKIYGRGVAYWPGDAKSPPRIFFGETGGLLAALDSRSGRPVEEFGDRGFVDVNRGVAENIDSHFRGGDRYTVPNPVTIYRNLVITGGRPGEAAPPGPRGDIRAWDARTGKLVWTFHTIPQRGELNDESWPGDSSRDRPGVNMWSKMTVDQERGMVFAPLGSASPDWYGGDRPGSNLYANSLIALDAMTGRLKWYAQLVHHDIWDYDLPTPPALIDVVRGGKTIPAVAQTGKMGMLFIFDRETGRPVFDIEERHVPQSTAAGEATSWTQPFPVKPPPLVRTEVSESEIGGVTPAHDAACKAIWNRHRMRNAGAYGVWSADSFNVVFPGFIGGPNWGDVSFDRKLGYMFVNVNNAGQMGQLTPHPENPRFPYSLEPESFVDPATGWPCQLPPWGELLAVDVNKGDIAWRVPLGDTGALKKSGMKTGTLNLGGNIATSAGVVFVAATNDSQIRAFDSRSGRELWSAPIEAGGHSTPATYIGRDGRQYVVIAAGGGTAVGSTRISDTLVAFSIP
jgi:glucose dehydrogenase